MKLYIKQKVFSLKSKFTVKDANGEDRYAVEGKMISIGRKLFVYNAAGEEVAYVKQKVPALLPKFTVEIGGQDVAEIVKKLSFLKAKYVVNGLDWNVQGDFTSHNYTVTQGEMTIAAIHKQWMAWGDTFEIDIAPGVDEVLALCVVLAIDAVMDSQAAAAAASASS